MTNKQLIEKFYSSFAKADPEGMVNCYADDVAFEDPAFGRLQGQDAKNMWRMLVSPNIKIDIAFDHVEANAQTGSANWQATYTFSQTGRKVVNKISASFEFKHGKIIKHIDHFNMWKWAGMALGFKGYLLGWTSFLQGKVRQQALKRLKSFAEKR